MRATAFNVSLGAHFKWTKIYWASYDFTAKSKRHHARTSVVQSVTNNLSQPNDQAIVLNDPDGSDRFELLPSITTQYQFVSASSKAALIRYLSECVMLFLMLGLGIAILQGTLAAELNGTVELSHE